MPSLSRLLALLVAVALVVPATRARADEPANTPPDAASAPVAPATATPAPVKATSDVPRPSFALAVGLGAGAVAVLVTGIALGAVAKSRESAANGDTSNPPLYTPSLKSQGDGAKSLANGAYACFAIGSAIAIADLVLWIEQIKHRKDAPAQAKRLDLTRPVATTITPSLNGLEVSF